MNKFVEAVDKHRQLILDAERYIWAHPETGYKEYETNKFMAKEFEKLGYHLTFADGITGFYTVLDTGREGPEILVLAELDSVICPTHPESDKQTGAVHSCGHNAQCASLLGLAAALKEKGILDDMCGRIKLCVVPAEELLEIEFRSNLKKEGNIKHLGGKTEFLSRGYFDTSDIAFMVHTTTADFQVCQGGVGCLAKIVTYKGVASHAGGSPWNGKNALYAANCGLNAINALRETFKEEDIIRVHPIITSGGEMVNAIPDCVTLESYVRGKSYEAILDANKRINQALVGAALSLGVNVEIVDFPGYAPLNNDRTLMEITKQAADEVISDVDFRINEVFSSGSTDMGELSTIMPVVHPYAAGAIGKSHGNDYYIADAESACVNSAKMQLNMLNILLKDNALRAKQVVDNFKPMFKSKEEFFDFLEEIHSSGDRIEYFDKEAKVRL